MKKIIYSITKIGKKEQQKLTGIGYINDDDIIIACTGKNSKPYVRVFEGALKTCYPIEGTREFKGGFSEIREVELTDAKERKSTREIESDYFIWYKLVD